MRSSNQDYRTPAGASLAPAAVTLARHRSYALVSRLYLEGVTTQLLPYLQQIDALAPLLPQPFDADDAAAIHYHLFGFNVFAYETVFLGGDAAPAVEDQYRRFGYTFPATDLSADNIGHELGLMAFLSGAESDAWQDQRPDVARQLQRHQGAFLQNHLLRWLPALSEAIRRQGEPLYATLADLLQDLVQDHASALSLTAPDEDWWPQPKPLLEDENTGIRQIARHLAQPPSSGIYLSRDTLRDLARRLELPGGFGSREQLLENLLRAAVQYEALSDLLAALDELAARWQEAYQNAFVPPLDAFARPWHENVASTRVLLEQMATQPRHFDD